MFSETVSESSVSLSAKEFSKHIESDSDFVQDGMSVTTDSNIAGSAGSVSTTSRSDKYWFGDNITIKVGGNQSEARLYRVPSYFLLRDSPKIAKLISEIKSFKHQDYDVHLPDVVSEELEAFLSVLYPVDFVKGDIDSVKDWTSVLRFSTEWGFTSVRELAIIRLTSSATPLDKFVLARDCHVDEWVEPSLVALCIRPHPLTNEEGRRLRSDDICLIARAREEVRLYAGLCQDLGEKVSGMLREKCSKPLFEEAAPETCMSINNLRWADGVEVPINGSFEPGELKRPSPPVTPLPSPCIPRFLSQSIQPAGPLSPPSPVPLRTPSPTTGTPAIFSRPILKHSAASRPQSMPTRAPETLAPRIMQHPAPSGSRSSFAKMPLPTSSSSSPSVCSNKIIGKPPPMPLSAWGWGGSLPRASTPVSEDMQ